MLVAILRIVFKVPLKYLFLILYGALFLIVAIAYFTNGSIIPLAFDSGGVTTGPITVPFLIALSSGIVGVLGGSGEDSEFGTIGICSVGPILQLLFSSHKSFLTRRSYFPLQHKTLRSPSDILEFSFLLMESIYSSRSS